MTVIDTLVLNNTERAGHVTRRYLYFRHQDCPDRLWGVCLQLQEVLDRDLTFFAPSAPF